MLAPINKAKGRARQCAAVAVPAYEPAAISEKDEEELPGRNRVVGLLLIEPAAPIHPMDYRFRDRKTRHSVPALVHSTPMPHRRWQAHFQVLR